MNVFAKSAASLALSAVCAGVGLAVTAAPSQAVTGQATAMVTTQRMAGPSLTTRQYGWYAAGTRVTLTCYDRGQAVAGYYSRYVAGGRSNLWYKTSDGAYVADIDLNTGSNNPVTGPCTAAPVVNPPVATSGRAWGRTEPRNTAYAGQCTYGAKEQFRAYAGVYPALTGNAKDWAASARAAGWTVVADGQAASIVVFQPGVQGAHRVYGHVGWVDQVQRRADGLYVHVVEMNAAAGPGRYSERWVKDVPGMSYVLAPRR